MRRYATVHVLYLVLGLVADFGTLSARPVIMERTAAADSDVPPGTAGPYNPGIPGNPASRIQ